MVFLLIVGAGAFMWLEMQGDRPGGTTANKIEGQAFFLLGNDNTPVAMLTNAKKGPELFVSRDKRSLQLQVAQDDAGLEIRNGDATLRVRVAVGNDDASIKLFDAAGKAVRQRIRDPSRFDADSQ